MIGSRATRFVISGLVALIAFGWMMPDDERVGYALGVIAATLFYVGFGIVHAEEEGRWPR